MKKDFYLSFVVLFQMIVVTIQMLLPLYGIVGEEQAARFRILITLATYIPAIVIVFLKRPQSIYIPFAIYLVVLLFSYALFPLSHKFIESKDTLTLTPIAILTAIFVYNIKNIDNFKQILLIICRLSPIFAVLYVWGTQHSPFISEDFSYSMSFGYSFLLPSLFLFTQEKWIDKSLSILMFLLILIGGSRGPVIVMFLYYCLDLTILSAKKFRILPLVVFFVAGVVLLLILPNYVDFSSSRTLGLFESGEGLNHLSGREELYAGTQKAIMENPILGNGLGSDRIIVGFYCHDIFLEIFCHYGIIVGSIFFLLLFIEIVKLYRNNNLLSKQGGKKLFVIIVMSGFIPMFVSGSYLTEFKFAFMIGFILRLVNCRVMFNKSKRHLSKERPSLKVVQ